MNCEPANPDYRNNLGFALVQSGHPDQGIAEFQCILAPDPQNLTARINTGFGLTQKAGLDKGPHNTLAQVLHAEGDEAGSRKEFECGAEANKRIEARQTALLKLNAGLESLAREDLAAAEQ